MSQKLKVSFDDPEHGWVGMIIVYGDQVVKVIASYTPNDSFLGLVNTLHSLLFYEDRADVTWHEEPAETELCFSRSEDVVTLEVYEYPGRHRSSGKGNRVLKVAGKYEEVCLPFWHALRSLQGRFTMSELAAKWHRSFPSREMELLTAAIEEKKSGFTTSI